MRIRLTACVVVALVTLSRAAAAPPQDRAAGQFAGFYSPEKEAALGAMLARETLDRARQVQSPAAQAYLARLGRRLAAELPSGGPAYTFEILAHAGNSLQQPAVLPGGYIFVPAALFTTAGNEAEFAGVFAHALAHAAERHGVRTAQRGEVLNLASIPIIFLGGWSGIDGPETLLPAGLARIGRELEIEADRLAVRAMAQAGFDPRAFLGYIDRRQAEDSALGSPLPPRERRLSEISQAIAELPTLSYSSDTDEFEQVREEVRALFSEIEQAIRN
jgi:predicted Zn-dependent protease